MKVASLNLESFLVDFKLIPKKRFITFCEAKIWRFEDLNFGPIFLHGRYTGTW